MPDRLSFVPIALAFSLLVAPPLPAQSAADTAAAPADAPLPTAEELSKRHLAAIGGEEAVRKRSHATQKGTISMPSMGLGGPVTMVASEPDLYLMTVTMPGVGEVRTGFDGTVAWSEDQMQGPRLMEGGELAQIKREANFRRDLDILSGWDTVKVAGRTAFGGLPCLEVEVTSGGETSRFYFEESSGLYRGSRMSTQSPLGQVQVETVISDYREFDGLKVPMRTELTMMGQKQVLTVDSVSFDPVDPKMFELPAPIKALADAKPKDAPTAKPPETPAAPPADPAPKQP